MTYFRFEWSKKQDKKKSDELGRPFYIDAVQCRFLKAGGDICLWVDEQFKKSHFENMRPNDKVKEEETRRMRDEYERFMKEGEKREEGLSIDEWPMVSRAEAENLRVVGITTVEGLAALTDSKLKEVGINRALRDKAGEYLAFAIDTGAAAAKSVKQNEEIERLREELKELKTENARLLSKLSEESKEPKRKRE